jgi:hypothetical protein
MRKARNDPNAHRSFRAGMIRRRSFISAAAILPLEASWRTAIYRGSRIGAGRSGPPAAAACFQAERTDVMDDFVMIPAGPNDIFRFVVADVVQVEVPPAGAALHLAHRREGELAAADRALRLPLGSEDLWFAPLVASDRLAIEGAAAS